MRERGNYKTEKEYKRDETMKLNDILYEIIIIIIIIVLWVFFLGKVYVVVGIFPAFVPVFSVIPQE